MRWKLADIAVMLVLPAAATMATVTFRTNLFVSILLYFGLPSVYLMARNPGIVAKGLRFALIFFIPLSLFFDTLAAINGAYIIPDTIFPFRVLGISTVELYLYAFFWILFPVLFYEHFFDKGTRGDTLSSRTKYLVYIMSVLAFAVVILFYARQDWLRIPYCYFVLAAPFIFIPVVLFLWRYPEFLKRNVLIAAYFFTFMLVFELAALHNEQWIFPGQFVGMVSVLGYAFPFEELFFWMIFGTPALLVYYEFFADNRKL